MGLASKFTKEQDAFIASFYPEWDEESAKPGVHSKWKGDKADEILKSPLFLNHLPGDTPEVWRARLIAKFKNRKTRVAVKEKDGRSSDASGSVSRGAGSSGSSGVSSSALASAKTFFTRPTLTGRSLFEIEKREEIWAVATAEAKKQGVVRPLAFRGPAAKAAWEALSAEEVANYNQRALTLRHDVGINQACFEKELWAELDSFTKSGLFGDMTITILFGYRTPDDQLRRGHVSSTSTSSEKRFDELGTIWDNVYEQWGDFTVDALPPKAKSSEIAIPLDTDGTPIFPEIDLDATPPAKVALAIKQFVQCLWTHCRPGDSFAWEKAGAHYDKVRFTVPLAMESLDSVSGVNALIVANFFKGLQNEDRFVFNSENDGDGDGDGQDEGRGRLAQGQRQGQGQGQGKGKDKEKAKAKTKNDGDGEDEDDASRKDKGKTRTMVMATAGRGRRLAQGKGKDKVLQNDGDGEDEDDASRKDKDKDQDRTSQAQGNDGDGTEDDGMPENNGDVTENEDDASGKAKGKGKGRKSKPKKKTPKAKGGGVNAASGAPAPKRKRSPNDKEERPPKKTRLEGDAGPTGEDEEGVAGRPRRARREVPKMPTAAKPVPRGVKPKGMRGYVYVGEDGEVVE
ncbi:hypothetical protein B0H12DRAFT_1246798 [Mycena haematopus]|nr:hypothetical protein B0H12DRAFT_1246798 [Mycena haematopus]